MRIVIIGAVAAGTSAAAKARRNNETAEIVIYEKDNYISYSGCGMPYYLGDEVVDLQKLTPRNPDFFKTKYNVDVLIRHEVMSISPTEKKITVKNLESGAVIVDYYDKLVIATGASATVPPILGADREHVFVLRSINDMLRIKDFINAKKISKVAIVGTGFIGLEVCENLVGLGISVTLIEKLPQVTPGLDRDMAIHVLHHLKEKGIRVILGASIQSIEAKTIELSNGVKVEASMVLLSTGVRPNTALAKAAGISLGTANAIQVNSKMQTNINDIYACGDCIEHFHLITNKPVYRPLGSTANKTGRITGDQITGGSLEFRGILGTGIFRVFEMTVAMTGLSEKEAIDEGFDPVICHNIKPHKPEYLNGKEMVIKGVADRKTGRLLGAQIVGKEGVDKRIDVFATAITFQAKVEDLFHLDLAYAPPFSTTKDPVMYTGMILDNIIHRNRPVITKTELQKLQKQHPETHIMDARAVAQFKKDHLENAENMMPENLRKKAAKLDPEKPYIVYCNKGTTGNAAQNILLNNGFKKVFNLSGGFKQYKAEQEDSL